uniref:Uncharacterized protein n=1 Tax=Amazona collaria TaxID=241587 RepID=A0A8B9GM07_9PSIT
MAAPMELFCWAGGWGLPSVDPDCLAVLTYARFTGAPLKVHRVSTPRGGPPGEGPPPPPGLPAPPGSRDHPTQCLPFRSCWGLLWQWW